MEIVWQASSETPAKRRISQACQSCRARKKRCYHDEKAQNGVNGPRTLRPELPEINPRESSPRPGPVSEYNPESVLTGLAKPSDPVLGDEPPDSNSPHLRHGQSPVQPPGQSLSVAQRRLIWYKRHRRRPPLPKLSEIHQKYLEDAGAFLQLPRVTTDALLPIYLSILDDLIPIMDGSRVFRDYSNGQASLYLVRAMCLVSCKADQAAPFLRLADGGPVLGPLDFATKLFDSLDVAMKADLEPDRITKIQILTLMHLHNDGQAGADRSTYYLSQALCEGWSMWLHRNIPGNPNQDQCDLLWWSLRNFDRLNKPMWGAGPFIIDDTDAAIDRVTPRKDNYRSQIMGVALTLGDLMTRATKVYKASSRVATDDCLEFPSLLELTSGTDFDSFHKSHKTYLEIWYHVAAMLSCRFSGPNTVQYNRRLASAERVIAILSRERRDCLPPLPLVPYAMSMSTTVIYRALRDSKRDPDVAHADLRLCCESLEVLSQRWTSTRGMVNLTRRLLMFIRSESGTLNGQEQGGTDQAPGDNREETVDGAASHRSATLVDMDSSRAEYPAEDFIPTPVSFQVNQVFHEVQEPDNTNQFQPQLVQNWSEMDTAYSQLNWSFHDLFDDRMPNLFQDPTGWELLHLENEEELLRRR